MKKDVVKIRQEMQALEDEKTLNPGFPVERAVEIAPYISQEVPTLFSIIYNESEKDYIQIANVMVDNLDKLNKGELNADEATEQLGKFLFNKLVKPNLPEQ